MTREFDMSKPLIPQIWEFHTLDLIDEGMSLFQAHLQTLHDMGCTDIKVGGRPVVFTDE